MSMTATDPASQPSILDEALRLAGLGWRVLPIKPGEKRPPMTSWQHAASADEATIRSWWTGLYRDHGLGVATGRLPSGEWLFVLDVDEKPGVSGAETLADLEAAHGALPTTVEAQTGSGGRHIYFTAPVEVRNDAGRRLGPGLDIRGEGGQVLAPPTLHPNGRPYAWLIGQEPGEHDVAPAPTWLVELLADVPLAAIDGRDLANPDDGPASRYNARTTWAELLERDGWTLHHTDRDGEQHWVRPGKERREGTSATVGYRGADMLRVFTSSVPWLPEGAYSRFGYHACREHGGDRSAAARAIVEAEAAELGPWRERLEAGASRTGIEGDGLAVDDEGDPLLGQLLDWSEFWGRERVGEDWLVRPFWPARRAVALVAPGGVGKSLLALYVAANIACGRPVFGQHCEPRSVLYLDYEMTADDLAERLEAMGFGPDVDMSNLHYALIPTLPPLDTRDGAMAVVRLSEMVAADAIVIDTFARAVQGEEDKADTIRNFYRHTGMALKRAGRAWLRVDHSGKDREKGARGSSAKRDDVDVEWEMVAQEGGAFTLKAKKRRVSWVPEVLQLQRMDDDVLEFRLPAGALGVTLPVGAGEIADRLDELGAPLDISYRHAAALLKEHGKATRAMVVRGALKWRRDKAARQLERARDDMEHASGRTSGRTGTHLPEASRNGAGRTPDASANPQVTDTGRTWDAPDAPDSSTSYRKPSPPVGGRVPAGTGLDSTNLLTDWIPDGPAGCELCAGEVLDIGTTVVCTHCGHTTPTTEGAS